MSHWSHQPKSITSIAEHPHAGPSGTPPFALHPCPGALTFSPQELFGEVARCSIKRPLDPLVPTPESAVYQALVSPNVDEAGAAFELLAQVDDYKDFVKTHFSGAVAQGIGSLYLQRRGYVWRDHFEKVVSAPSAGKRPDFVFNDPNGNVALLETKGSVTGSYSGLDAATSNGYWEQVYPHLGAIVGGQAATHGFAVGTWMKPRSQPKMSVHRTEPPTPLAPAAATKDEKALPSPPVLVGHFRDVFWLQGSAPVANALVSRTGPSSEWLFREYQIEGTPFLTFVGDNAIIYGDVLQSSGLLMRPGRTVGVFGILKVVAEKVFDWMQRRVERAGAPFHPPIADDRLINLARQLGTAAVFPDGLVWCEFPALRFAANAPLLHWQPGQGLVELKSSQ